MVKPSLDLPSEEPSTNPSLTLGVQCLQSDKAADSTPLGTARRPSAIPRQVDISRSWASYVPEDVWQRSPRELRQQWRSSSQWSACRLRRYPKGGSGLTRSNWMASRLEAVKNSGVTTLYSRRGNGSEQEVSVHCRGAQRPAGCHRPRWGDRCSRCARRTLQLHASAEFSLGRKADSFLRLRHSGSAG